MCSKGFHETTCCSIFFYFRFNKFRNNVKSFLRNINFIYRKFKRDEMKSGTLVMALNFFPVALILLLTLVPGGLLGKTGDAVLFTISYGVIYILQLAFGHILISLVPLRFSSIGLAATLTGLTNAINYGGSAISTYGMSLAVEYMPMYGMVLIWLGCLVFATVFLTISSLKWKNFIKKDNE